MTFGALAVAFVAASPHPTTAAADQDGAISFDGDMSDWPGGAEAVATDRWVYFRYDAGAPTSLQNGPVMTVLQIDLDSDARTGLVSEDGALGIDLEISMTRLDHRDPTRLGGGVEISAFGPEEQHESLGSSDAGFACLPTHAATGFELRVARDLAGPGWLRAAARTTGGLRYRFIDRDENYLSKRTGETRALTLPAMTAGRALFDAAIPRKTEGSLRLVSWNVLWGTPSKQPDGFARTLRSLNPDVILFQEWDNGYWTNEDRFPERKYVDWLGANLGGGAWSVRRGGERGVVVASRSRMSEFLPERIIVPAARAAGNAREHVIRCASARIETPMGEVGAVSIHLKSQGGLDSSEDRTRLAEARAVHDAIRGAMATRKPDFLVISGDWNLVGGRAPLETVTADLDFDGTPLLVAEPRRLGAGDAITWRDQRSPFAPGRLDYAVVADDGVELERAFILDTSLLTDASLRAAGLERKDTDGSDHLPLVFDLRRKNDR